MLAYNILVEIIHMKITQQVCTLEQAIRLKELGVEQKSQLFFVPWKASDFDGCFIGAACDKGFYHCLDGMVETFDAPIYYSAFSTSELGILLPTGQFLTGYILHDQWGCGYNPIKQGLGGEFSHGVYGDTEAQARAAMCIYLLEKKMITPEECNKRLSA
jgi:hypothetical protein